MELKKYKNYIVNLIIFLLLGSLFTFHFAVSYKILSKTKAIKSPDFATRAGEGRAVRNIILSKSSLKERLKELYSFFVTLEKDQYHPNLFGLVNGICRTLVRDRMDEDELVHAEDLLAPSVFFLILLISMYKIGALLYNRKIGIFLSFFISFVPSIFSSSRVQMLDLPLTAMCTLSLFFLLRTRGFTSLFYSISAGIIWGLSQLTKESFLIFFLPAFLSYVYFSLRKNKEASPKKVWSNIILSLTIFSLIAGMVYLNPQNHIALKAYHLKGSLVAEKKTSLLFYIFAFPFAHFHPVIFLVLLPFFIIYVLKAKPMKDILFYSFIIPFFFFSLSPNKYERFLLPLIPVFILICTEGMVLSLKGRIKTICLTGLLILSAIQFIIISSGRPFYFWYYKTIEKKFKFASYLYNSVGIPFSFDGNVDYLLKPAEQISKMIGSANKERINITLTFENCEFQAFLMNNLNKREIKSHLDNPVDDPAPIFLSKQTIDFDKVISESDYVIDCNEWWRQGLYFAQEIKQAFLRNKELFTLVLELNPNKNTNILVYKNKNF
jgi:hypothetical protein